MIKNLPISFAPEESFEVPIEDLERQGAIKAISFLENAAHILNAYQSHQRGQRALLMSRDAMWLALDFRLAAGADGPAELARKHGVSKQRLGKCLNYFIAQLALDPLLCQRNQEARQNMSAARKEQVEQKI